MPESQKSIIKLMLTREKLLLDSQGECVCRPS